MAPNRRCSIAQICFELPFRSPPQRAWGDATQFAHLTRQMSLVRETRRRRRFGERQALLDKAASDLDALHSTVVARRKPSNRRELSTEMRPAQASFARLRRDRSFASLGAQRRSGGNSQDRLPLSVPAKDL